MSRLYWRPPGISRTALVLVALVAGAAHVAVEALPTVRKQSSYRDKIQAARLAEQGMAAIKAEKLGRGYRAARQVDPVETGMIGESVTAVTSNTGVLPAKLTSTNPNFAAVVVHLAAQAGLQKGDTVAVGVSGSFPALNVSTYAAIHVLGLRPIVVASASSSEWGANHADYLWLDMEATLRERLLLDIRSAAASYGGIDDLGIGITKKGLALLDASMARNSVRFLDPSSLEDSVDKRMALYDELAGDAPIRAYVNVGGGSASVGTHVGKKQFRPGLNTQLPSEPNSPDSVMLRFAKRGVPVIHISRLKLLCERYGLPWAPRTVVPVGQGNVFVKAEHNRALAALGLLLVLAVAVAFIRWDAGTRLLSSLRPARKVKAPEQMV
jgi:poly-gamma-glutamate system protein